MGIIKLSDNRLKKKKAFEEKMRNKASRIVDYLIDNQVSYDDLFTLLEEVYRIAYTLRYLLQVKEKEIENLKACNNTEDIAIYVNQELKDILDDSTATYESKSTRESMLSAINKLCKIKDTLNDKTKEDLEEIIGLFIDEL